MKTFALKTSNEDFQGLVKDLSALIDIEFKDGPKEILLEIADCEAILLDLDTDTRAMDKLIKKVRKFDSEVPLFVLCNSFDNKKLTKHQSSKVAPDLYFRYPTDPEVLEIMVSEFFEFEDGPELSDTETALVAKHEAVNELPDQVIQANSKLDNAFEDALPNEFEELQDLNKAGESLEVESDGLEVLEEFDMGSEEEFDMGSEEEFKMDENDAADEFSLDENDAADDSSELLSLSEEDELEENIEPLETQLPSSEDLEFPDIQKAPVNTDLSEPEIDSADLSLGEDNELSLSEFDLSQTEGPESMELGDDLPEVSTSDDSNELKLDLGDSPEGELRLTSEEVPAEDEEINLSNEEQAESDDDLNNNSSLASDLGESLGIETDSNVESEDVDESFDPFAEVEDETPTEKEPDDGLKVSGELEIEEQTLGQTEIKNIFGKQGDKEDSFASSIEDIDLFDTAQDDGPKGTSIDLDETSVENDLPEAPPEFTSEFQTKINEIDALTQGHEEDQTQISTLDEGEDRTRVSTLDNSNEDATIVSGLDNEARGIATGASNALAELKAENAAKSDTEDQEDVTKVYQAQDLVNQIESSDEDDVHVNSRISQSVSQDTKQDLQDYIATPDEELIRMGETIKSLRADREKLLLQVTELEDSKNIEKRDFLSLQAELDERKIEVEVLKKRYSKEVEDLKFRLDMTSDRKEVLIAKNKQIEQEFDKIRHEKKLDINRVRARERELEEKLELLKTDSEVQLRNRDHKILELKRRIDTMEFDIENAHLRERKKTTDKDLLEDRLDKVIKTLRGVIGQIEDDSIDERRKIIKKNMDV